MSAFYDNMAVTAERLLTTYGQSVQVLYDTSSTYDVATQKAESGTSGYVANGVVSQFSVRDIDGASILTTDIRLVIGQATVPPTIGGRGIIDGTTYRIIDVRTVSPGGTDIVYICQLRL